MASSRKKGNKDRVTRNDKASANVVEIDGVIARKAQREKAAARAIELHDKGKDFDEAIKDAVAEGRLDDVGGTFVRAQLIAHNLARAVALVRKQLEGDPSLSVDVLSQQAARKFASIKPLSVKCLYQTARARELVLAFLKSKAPEDATISEITAATGVSEATVKATVDNKTIFATRRNNEPALGTSPKAETAPRQRVVDYLTVNGKSLVADVMRSTGLKEKVVKDQVDKKEIFWAGKLDQKGTWCAANAFIALAGQRDQGSNEQTPSDGLPIIDVDTDSTPANVRDGIKALGTLKDVYVASGRLVRLFTVDDHVVLVPLTGATLHELLMIAAHWRTRSTDKYTQQPTVSFGPPPKTVVMAILERGIYDDLPEILGISTGPIITYDQVQQKPVFHVKTGFVPTEGNAGYYVYGEWDAPVSAKGGQLPPVHQMTCEEARARLESPLQGFRFENRDQGIAVVIATILTQFMRPMIRGPVPAVLVKAAKGSAGKTLLSRFIYAVAFGCDCPIKDIPIDTSKQKLDKKEFANSLAVDAFSRHLMQVYDNCDVEVGGDKLEMCLTSTSIRIRLFHTQTDALVKWLMTLIFNGCEPELVGNVARRMLRIQLLHNEATQFEWGTEDAFIATIKQPGQRKVFVEALMVIVRSYFDSLEPIEGTSECVTYDLNGKAIQQVHWPSFGAWSQLVPMILRHAGFADPTGARILDEEAEDSTRRDALSVMALVELLMRENDSRLKKPLTKMAKRDTCGILMSDLIDHVGSFSGASKPEYEEGWRVLLAKVPGKDRGGVNASHARLLARRCRDLKLNELSAELPVGDQRVKVRFIIGADRKDAPVVAVISD